MIRAYGSVVSSTKVSRLATGAALLALMAALVTGAGAASVPVRPAGDHEPRWSPDGRWIAFARIEEATRGYDDLSLYVVAADGSAERRLARLNLDEADFGWTLDGARLGFSTRPSDGEGSYLRESRPDGSGLRRIGGGWFVGWQLDGVPVFSICDEGYKPPTCVPRQMRPGRQSGQGCVVSGAFLGSAEQQCRDEGWEPGGKRRVEATYREPSAIRVAENGRYRDLAQGVEPEWSPREDVIAFLQGSYERGSLAVISADGTGLRVLTPALERVADVRWSPDGSRIGFVADGRLTVVRADGSGLAVVAERVGEGGALGESDWQWSPEGSRILYASEKELWSVTLEGAGRERLLSADQLVGARPSFAPNGSRFAFAGPSGAGCPGHRSIFTVQLDGTGLRNLTGACTGGGRTANSLVGSPRRDVLYGNGGADRLAGGAGNDFLAGGDGRDRLDGGHGADLLEGGGGFDTLVGGRGDDSITAQDDGTRDAVSCGPGRDEVRADRVDHVARDCELVVRF